MNDFDEGWIKKEIESYSVEHTTAENTVLAKLSRATYLRTHQPQMLSGHLQGMFLQQISRMIKPINILEIGTFTGYSAICLAQGLQPGGRLTTIECNPEMQDFATPFFVEAGLSEKIKMLIGDASQLIPQMEGPFDLVFIDADKESYSRYFELVFNKIVPGGFVLVDNTLWYGRVIEQDASKDKETAAIMEFNRMINERGDIENILLPIRDGITIIRKK